MQNLKVIIIIDNSKSTKGNLNGIKQGIEVLAQGAPPSVVFDLRSFNTEVTKVACGPLSTLGLTNALQQFEDLSMESGSKCVYDALGGALQDISGASEDITHILLITNGADNSSKIFTFETVINLLQQKFSQICNMHLTTIHSGASTPFSEALQKFYPAHHPQLLQSMGPVMDVMALISSVQDMNRKFDMSPADTPEAIKEAITGGFKMKLGAFYRRLLPRDPVAEQNMADCIRNVIQ